VVSPKEQVKNLSIPEKRKNEGVGLGLSKLPAINIPSLNFYNIFAQL